MIHINGKDVLVKIDKVKEIENKLEIGFTMFSAQEVAYLLNQIRVLKKGIK